MIDQSLVLLCAGGLFDFGATLPALALQFLLLMTVLNSVLYTPLLTIINYRNNCILESLSESADLLNQASELNLKCEKALNAQRGSAKFEIKLLQDLIKTYTDNYLVRVDKWNRNKLTIARLLGDFRGEKLTKEFSRVLSREKYRTSFNTLAFGVDPLYAKRFEEELNNKKVPTKEVPIWMQVFYNIQI